MSDPPPANAGDIFAQWQDGTLTDIAALRSLWSDLREVESDLAPLEAAKAHLRDQIGQIVAKLGPIELAGFGKALITNPSVSFSYDRERVDTIIAELRQTHPEIAAQLTSARKRSERGLRERKPSSRSSNQRNQQR
jgi:hypothetical protein